ncbi:hypothetical protein SAMN05421805_110140 [Saccharopolyspora antimicrobica]|uniref:Uncharacterized protein n=1 Tax=Saccharopolyspora antimicrobica TaxID=455193 RepID=A0A1I5F1K2_9PSEU|nr:hypothetical protein ATL45_1934 [Saccharopolyspora antimicrobica]SFO17634.1 hypothetical protein SAMN05421805_110140 [Saccharopolyspora antimicrobica]
MVEGLLSELGTEAEKREQPRQGDNGDATDGFDEEPLSFKEMLGLPDRLPPLRLPSEEELAAAARQSRLLDCLRSLASRAVEHSRGAEDWTAAEVTAAAEALGLPVPETVEGLADVPDLARRWDLAVDAEFIDPATAAAPGPALDEWPSGSDEDVLDVWSDVLGLISEDAFQGEDVDPELADDGAFALVMLFMTRHEGIPAWALRRMVADVVEVEPEEWERWVETSGDLADRLLAILVDLGAAQVDDEIARLTPLGQYALAGALTEDGVEVPILPSAEEMTAGDLVEFAVAAGDAELAAEREAWLQSRTPAEAVDELIASAASGDVEHRVIAMTLAKSVEGAEQQWRQALDDPALAPYAKSALQESGAPDVEPTPADAAWLLADLLSAGAADDQDDLAALLADSVPAGQEAALFDQIWRLDHPHAQEVLTLIGDHHPDKKIAKAARKAAHKVPTR